jgi:hypothetical protein
VIGRIAWTLVQGLVGSLATASSEATPHAVGDGTEEQQDNSGNREGPAELRLEARREGDKDYQQQGKRREHD